MYKRWLWGIIGYCFLWWFATALVGVVKGWLNALPFMLGWMPRDPNTAYFVSNWVELLLWTPFIFLNRLLVGSSALFGKWLLLFAAVHLAITDLIHRRHCERIIFYSTAIGWLLGMLQLGMSAVLPAPMLSTPDVVIIDPGEPPSYMEKLLDYGIPAQIASTVSGLWVGWLWRVYPLRIRIELMQDADDEWNRQ